MKKLLLIVAILLLLPAAIFLLLLGFYGLFSKKPGADEIFITTFLLACALALLVLAFLCARQLRRFRQTKHLPLYPDNPALWTSVRGAAYCEHCGLPRKRGADCPQCGTLYFGSGTDGT